MESTNKQNQQIKIPNELENTQDEIATKFMHIHITNQNILVFPPSGRNCLHLLGYSIICLRLPAWAVGIDYSNKNLETLMTQRLLMF